MGSNTAVVTCTVALPRDVPEWVQLMTLGRLVPSDGRGPWTLDDAAKVVTASMTGRDLVLDYEHQTDLAQENGRAAPAAGWIKELAVRADGIWARVEWTERAAAMIRAGEYRYLSPVFYFDKKTGAVTRILRAALTNNPALELKAVAKRKEDDMTLEELLDKMRAALGLADSASADDCIAACASLAKGAKVLAGLPKTLGLKDDAGADAIAAATSRAAGVARAATAKLGLKDDADAGAVETALAKHGGNPDPDKYVARAAFDELNKKVGTLESERAREKATAKVDEAIKLGKIAPAQREWAIDYATRQPAEFDGYAKKLAVIVAPGGGPATGKPKAGDPLTADEKATCRMLGLDEAAFKKTRDEQLAATSEEIS